MRKLKKVITSLLVFAVIMQGSIVFAEEDMNYTEIAKAMIANYESSNAVKEKATKQDDRFVNEMSLKQAEKKRHSRKTF